MQRRVENSQKTRSCAKPTAQIYVIWTSLKFWISSLTVLMSLLFNKKFTRPDFGVYIPLYSRCYAHGSISVGAQSTLGTRLFCSKIYVYNYKLMFVLTLIIGRTFYVAYLSLFLYYGVWMSHWINRLLDLTRKTIKMPEFYMIFAR